MRFFIHKVMLLSFIFKIFHPVGTGRISRVSRPPLGAWSPGQLLARVNSRLFFHSGVILRILMESTFLISEDLPPPPTILNFVSHFSRHMFRREPFSRLTKFCSFKNIAQFIYKFISCLHWILRFCF